MSFQNIRLMVSCCTDPQNTATQSTDNPLTTQPTTPTSRGSVYVCHSHYHEIWLLVIYVYKCVILLYGTHLSWATRNVALSAMNDSRCIIISVYTCVILVSMTTALSSTMWRWPNVWYSCMALVLLLLTTQVLVLVHVPKVRVILTSSRV